MKQLNKSFIEYKVLSKYIEMCAETNKYYKGYKVNVHFESHR